MDAPAQNSTTFMHELNEGEGAVVYSCLVPLVKFLNRLHVKTISSRIGIADAAVTFTGEYQSMSELLFKHLKSMTDHLEGVQLEMLSVSGSELIGMVRIPNGCLDEVTRRVGCWMEQMRK